MKRKIVIPLALISIASFSLVGCSDNTSNKNDKDDDKVIAGVFDELKSETSNDTTKEEGDNENLLFEDTKENKLKTFDENVKLKYPSSWEKEVVNGATIFYIDDTYSTNINLVKESLRGYSEDEYIEASIESVKYSFDTDEVALTEEEFNGYNGYILEYETEAQGQTIKLVQPTIFYNGDAYIFTIGGYPKNVNKQIDNVMSILNTIEFE